MSISAPAAWGKLPAWGDYVRLNAGAADIEGWQQWFATFPLADFGGRSPPQQVPHQPARREQPGTDWHNLEPREWHEKRIAHPLPWSFVLPPRMLPFAANGYVVGVMTESCDKVGRRHPFVIYQSASRAWLKQHLAEPQNLLFWWARLLMLYTPPVIQPAASSPSIALEYRLEQLWQLHRPNWLQRLGFGRGAMHLRTSRELIGPSPDNDPSQPLQGVVAPPWAQWPHTLWQDTSLARFWQQDGQGRYVGQREVGLGGKVTGEVR